MEERQLLIRWSLFAYQVLNTARQLIQHGLLYWWTIVAFNSSISFVKVVSLVYISDPLAGKQQCNVYMPFSSNQPIGQGSHKNV